MIDDDICEECEGTGHSFDDDRGEVLADRCLACDGTGEKPGER